MLLLETKNNIGVWFYKSCSALRYLSSPSKIKKNLKLIIKYKNNKKSRKFCEAYRALRIQLEQIQRNWRYTLHSFREALPFLQREPGRYTAHSAQN